MVRQGESLVVETPAKLNLFLEVLGRRVDGYHDLETVMLAVSLCDTLHFRTAGQGELRFHQKLALTGDSARTGAPSAGDDNLVLRAARRLAEVTGCRRGAAIELTKRIPWQAGMGGGSSDAAATLLALNVLWELRLSVVELHAIAASLGSDLNFFIARTPLALCRGRGEVVEPRPLRRRLDFVVVQPRGGLSTAAVFQWWRRHSTVASPDRLLAWLAGEAGVDPRSAAYNALQQPACQLHAGIDNVCRRLSGSGVMQPRLTGSGSACFGLCRTRRQAECVARRWRMCSSARAWAVSSI